MEEGPDEGGGAYEEGGSSARTSTHPREEGPDEMTIKLLYQ